ncbi:hypothetical protein F5B18DRAFT_628277 [Nemania serpens]|nr:hypothetical protein F5B18DRAFT_628277 [Nemania serpens]
MSGTPINTTWGNPTNTTLNIPTNTTLGIVYASSTSGGLPETTYNSTTCAVVEYQTVTSHGNAAVSDADKPTVIQCKPGYSVLSPVNYKSGNKPGVVHVPIAAPIAMVQNPAKLKDIVVKFTSANKATIDNIYLYYDTASVASANTSKSSTFFVSFSDKESTAAAYSAEDPKGICLTLDINFPSKDASISLTSVELVYLYN